MRILLADDEDGLRRSLEQWLQIWGYEVMTARDGTEAWRMLKRDDSPRVAILDWDMPGLSGPEVCRLLRAAPHGGDVYIVILTAKGEKDDVVEALESGADDFLSKPFHARELQLRLAKGVRDSARASPKGPATAAPPSGSALGGKYRLEAMIARGGMGSVWRGVHLSLGVDVAIKFMAPELADTSHYASFEREARAAALLRNEHVVRVYDHGISHEGLPYLVMEYIAGESLAAVITRRGRLSPVEVVALVEQACEALEEAHGHGIVHRDVKPENILLVDAPKRGPFFVKLIDFGLADPGGARAAPGTAGTPNYMSPEYLRGETPPNPLLDLWGLAATTYQAVTGQMAFGGTSMSEIYKKVCADPAPLPSKAAPGTPPAFDAWFLRACAPDPGARFQNAGEFTSALLLALQGSALPPPAGASGDANVTDSLAPTMPDAKHLPGHEAATPPLGGRPTTGR